MVQYDAWIGGAVLVLVLVLVLVAVAVARKD